MKTEEIIGGTFEEWKQLNIKSLQEEFLEAYEKPFNEFCRYKYKEEMK